MRDLCSATARLAALGLAHRPCRTPNRREVYRVGTGEVVAIVDALGAHDLCDRIGASDA